MSLRSRALLSGVGRGFFQAQNQRRRQMAERMEALATNRAEMARERAKSRYDSISKEARAENNKWRALRADGDIDAEGNYQDTYYDKLAYAQFKDKGNRAAEGMSFEEFRDNLRKISPKKFTRQYKDPDVINNDLTKLYASIDARKQAELDRPVLTGFDRMLSRGVSSVVDLVGEQVEGLTEGKVGITSLAEPSPTKELPTEETFSPFREQEISPEGQEGVTERPTFTPSVPEEIETTYKTYDAQGNEHIVIVGKDKSVTTKATGLQKQGSSGVIEMKLADLKKPVDQLVSNRIRDGIESQRLIGEILEDTSVETSATLPKLYANIIQRIQNEYVGTVGSVEEKNRRTLEELGAAFTRELNDINTSLPEDQRITPNERQKLNSKVRGLDQNKRALAYALVRLNRTSGRFNGQELNEQLDLLKSNDLAGAASVLKRAQEQVKAALDRDIQEAAASVLTTHLVASGKQGQTQYTKNEILGWVKGSPVYDPQNKSYYVDFREGPYEFAYMTANGGVELVPRQTEE